MVQGIGYMVQVRNYLYRFRVEPGMTRLTLIIMDIVFSDLHMWTCFWTGQVCGVQIRGNNKEVVCIDCRGCLRRPRNDGELDSGSSPE